MPDEQTQPTASGTSTRTYMVFRYTTAEQIRKALDEGLIQPTEEVLLPVGFYESDDADAAIKAVAKRDNFDKQEHAAVPARNFRRRKPVKRVTEIWGFED